MGYSSSFSITELLVKDGLSFSTVSSARRAIVYNRALYTNNTRPGSVTSGVQLSAT